MRGGSTYQVPIEIEFAQKETLVICWLVRTFRKHSGWNMVFKLSYELMDVARDNENVIRRKEETHRMVEVNRIFAHFRQSINTRNK